MAAQTAEDVQLTSSPRLSLLSRGLKFDFQSSGASDERLLGLREKIEATHISRMSLDEITVSPAPKASPVGLDE